MSQERRRIFRIWSSDGTISSAANVCRAPVWTEMLPKASNSRTGSASWSDVRLSRTYAVAAQLEIISRGSFARMIGSI